MTAASQARRLLGRYCSNDTAAQAYAALAIAESISELASAITSASEKESPLHSKLIQVVDTFANSWLEVPRAAE